MPTAHERLPLGALRVFEAVATCLNFSAAAEALELLPAVRDGLERLQSAARDFPGPDDSGNRVSGTVVGRGRRSA
jgi:hypothetical protein